jgi:hypothetical protein
MSAELACGESAEKGRNTVGRLWVYGGAAVAYLATASVALAQQPTEQGYGGVAGGVQGEVEGGGTLPFTGFDLMFLVVGGLVLLAAGLTLRRLGRARG